MDAVQPVSSMTFDYSPIAIFHKILEREVSTARAYSGKVESSSRDADVRTEVLEGRVIHKAAPLLVNSLLPCIAFTFYCIQY